MPVPGVRKSGMPEGVEIPAPVRTKIFLNFFFVMSSISASRVYEVDGADVLLRELFVIELEVDLLLDREDEERSRARLTIKFFCPFLVDTSCEAFLIVIVLN